MQYSDFDQEVHALILERGLAYFENGAVEDLNKSPDGWTALIKGNEEYRVIIRGEKEIEEWHCVCPYDHGPVCKHVVAALYAIREKIEEERKTRAELLDKLADIEGEALKRFLRERLHTLDNFKEEFLDYFEEE